MMLVSIKKLFQFSLKEQWLLVNAWFVFLKWDFLIAYVNFERWREKLNLSVGNSNQCSTVKNDINLKAVKLIISISEVAGRNHIRKMNCLRRCLTQKQLLNNRGYETEMHIGVTLTEGNLSAHIWLTYNNNIINDSEDVVERYKELKTINNQEIINTLI